MRLAELQLRYQRAVIGAVPDFTDEELGFKVKGGDEPHLRINLHRRNFWSKVHMGIGWCYPLLHEWLGEDELRKILGPYVRAYPPTKTPGERIGSRLPEFLETTEPWSRYPIIAELARFEWRRTQCRHGAEERTLTVQTERVLRSTAPDVTIRLKKRAALLTSRFDWRAIDKSTFDRESPPLPEPMRFVIQVRNHRFRVEALDESSFEILSGLVAGRSLLALRSEMSERGMPTIEIERQLKIWIDADLLVAD